MATKSQAQANKKEKSNASLQHAAAKNKAKPNAPQQHAAANKNGKPNASQQHAAAKNKAKPNAVQQHATANKNGKPNSAQQHAAANKKAKPSAAQQHAPAKNKAKPNASQQHAAANNKAKSNAAQQHAVANKNGKPNSAQQQAVANKNGKPNSAKQHAAANKNGKPNSAKQHAAANNKAKTNATQQHVADNKNGKPNAPQQHAAANKNGKPNDSQQHAPANMDGKLDASQQHATVAATNETSSKVEKTQLKPFPLIMSRLNYLPSCVKNFPDLYSAISIADDCMYSGPNSGLTSGYCYIRKTTFNDMKYLILWYEKAIRQDFFYYFSYRQGCRGSLSTRSLKYKGIRVFLCRKRNSTWSLDFYPFSYGNGKGKLCLMVLRQSDFERGQLVDARVFEKFGPEELCCLLQDVFILRFISNQNRLVITAKDNDVMRAPKVNKLCKRYGVRLSLQSNYKPMPRIGIDAFFNVVNSCKDFHYKTDLALDIAICNLQLDLKYHLLQKPMYYEKCMDYKDPNNRGRR